MAPPASLPEKKYNGLKRGSPMKRTAIGEKRRTAVQHEAQQAKALEGDSTRLGLFYLHRVDWIHTGTPWRDTGTLRAGQPDYFLMGDGPDGPWDAWLEIKVRIDSIKYRGKLQQNQIDYHEKLRARGHEVMTAWLPRDLAEINDWLRSKTGRVVEVEL